MSDIPENMYYTMKAIISWANDRNIIQGSTPKFQLIKLDEELGEVIEAVDEDNLQHIIEEIGDMIVVLTIMCEMYKITIPQCAEVAYKKIKNRKGKMIDGIFVKEEV